MQEKLQIFDNTNQTSSQEIERLKHELSQQMEKMEKTSEKLEKFQKLSLKLEKQVEEEIEKTKECEEEVVSLKGISNDLRENLKQVNDLNSQYSSQLESFKNENRELNEQINQTVIVCNLFLFVLNFFIQILFFNKKQNLSLETFKSQKEKEEKEITLKHTQEIESQKKKMEKIKNDGEKIYLQMSEEHEQLKVSLEEVKSIFQQSELEYEDNIQRIKREQKSQESQFQLEFQKLCQKTEEDEKNYQKKIQENDEKYQRDLENVQKEHLEQLNRLQQEHGNKIESLNQKFNQEKNELNQKLIDAQNTFDQYSSSLIIDLNCAIQKEEELLESLKEKSHTIEELSCDFNHKLQMETKEIQHKFQIQSQQLSNKTEQLNQTMKLLERVSEAKEKAIRELEGTAQSPNSRQTEQLKRLGLENEKITKSNKMLIQQLQRKELDFQMLQKSAVVNNNSENVVNQIQIPFGKVQKEPINK